MKVVSASDASAVEGLFDTGWSVSEEIGREVADVISAVRSRGDVAIAEYARRFDDAAFELSRMRTPIPMLEGARPTVSRETAAALELAKARIARFHERQRQPDIAYVEDDGTRYALRRRALASVAVYAPKASAAIGVLMGAVPAKIAGVSRVAVFTPPAPEGMAASVLYACAICGVDELYAVGGAQAVAAAAVGTDSIAPVVKIVGRGGRWTTEAKRQVFGFCGIDSLAGPAEALIVADDGANSEYVAGELLAQAELPHASRLAVVSESRSLLEAVAQLIDTLDVRTLERHEFVSDAIATRCRLIEAKSREQLFEVVNRFAPAYLSLQVRDASVYLDRIHAAGTVFVGDMTPVVAGEYLAGINRAAPSAGTARFASSLSLSDFTRSFSTVEYSADRIASDAEALAALAEANNLPHHAQTARLRSGA
jgi:histidinol dehydrogenase